MTAGELAQVELLMAELGRLKAENKALLNIFSDRCQDSGTLGDALALARREGAAKERERCAALCMQEAEECWGEGRSRGYGSDEFIGNALSQMAHAIRTTEDAP